MKQCDNYSTSEQAQCCYVEGHSGEHFFSRQDESDRIRWKLAADQRDAVMAERDILRGQVENLTAECERLTKERDQAESSYRAMSTSLAKSSRQRNETANDRDRLVAECENLRARLANAHRLHDGTVKEWEAVWGAAVDERDSALAAADRMRGVLTLVRDDFDQAIAAHDSSDPRHRSHGGQHHNGPCCEFGNLTPGSVRHMRWLRDAIDSTTKDPAR